MRRMTLLLIGALAAAALAAAPAGGAPAIQLRPGDARLWNGPHIDSATASEGCDESSCFEYEIEVRGNAYRLRIGLDHAEVGDAFSFQVFDPSGVSRGTVNLGTGLYSGESLHESPDPGTWRVEVHADDVSDSSFRMRAKLEARPPSLGTKKGRVLPNLQVLPPHEATFMMPVTNGSQGDPPQGVEGGDSCHPEERAQDGAVRCLRFAFGIRNTGRGPMHLWHTGPQTQPHPLYQTVHRANGTSFDRDAGTAVWHESHAHYHHADAVAVELFAVTDREKGTLESAGPRHNKGFAHRNELLREWRRFYPTWTGDMGFGLLPGWADIYEWDRPGNYVDFGVNGDGYYVVRMWADPVDGILESNDRDNMGYTYFQVTGTDVELIEAGRGKHPWDPCKIVVGFGGHPDPKRGPRPDRCAPDTV
ncbi:MAG TPA: hypothetical protein VEU29_05540 [Actinomycetota bacterium]|nr:hypothetical protein [Actinomycetota bacterium]